MNLVPFKELKGLDTVSTEAYKFGAVADIRYNRDTWKVKGVRINQSSRFKQIYPEYRSKVMIAPSTKFRASDVLLLNFDKDELKPKITVDNDNVDMISGLVGKKVLTKEGTLLGTLEEIYLDLEKWTLVMASVKLDKEAHAPLNIKKLLFNKTVSGVKMELIERIGETIKLNVTLEQLRKYLIIEE